nr:uncharacterized protein LOC113815262 [Penaeus vannamei]
MATPTVEELRARPSRCTRRPTPIPTPTLTPVGPRTPPGRIPRVPTGSWTTCSTITRDSCIWVTTWFPLLTFRSTPPSLLTFPHLLRRRPLSNTTSTWLGGVVVSAAGPSEQLAFGHHLHHHMPLDHGMAGGAAAAASSSHHTFPNSVPGGHYIPGGTAVASYHRASGDLAGYHSPGQEGMANHQFPALDVIGYFPNEIVDAASNHHRVSGSVLGSDWSSRGVVVTNPPRHSPEEILPNQLSPHHESLANHNSPYGGSANQHSPSDGVSANQCSSAYETANQHSSPDEAANQHDLPHVDSANQHDLFKDTPANHHSLSDEVSANQHISAYGTANQHNPTDETANQHIPPSEIPANQRAPPSDTPTNQRPPSQDIPANDGAPPDGPANQDEARDDVTGTPSPRNTKSAKIDPLTEIDPVKSEFDPAKSEIDPAKSEFDPDRGQSENAAEESEKSQEKPFAFSHYLYNYLRSVKNIPSCESQQNETESLAWSSDAYTPPESPSTTPIPSPAPQRRGLALPAPTPTPPGEPPCTSLPQRPREPTGVGGVRESSQGGSDSPFRSGSFGHGRRALVRTPRSQCCKFSGGIGAKIESVIDLDLSDMGDGTLVVVVVVISLEPVFDLDLLDMADVHMFGLHEASAPEKMAPSNLFRWQLGCLGRDNKSCHVIRVVMVVVVSLEVVFDLNFFDMTDAYLFGLHEASGDGQLIYVNPLGTETSPTDPPTDPGPPYPGTDALPLNLDLPCPRGMGTRARSSPRAWSGTRPPRRRCLRARGSYTPS